MRKTVFGYQIENGKAVIDDEEAVKIRALYKNYLSGMALNKAAAAAGTTVYASSAKRILQNRRYVGDDFYPALIDQETFDQVASEIKRRAAALGRVNMKKRKTITRAVPTRFHISKTDKQFENPKTQAEYLYSLIESEEN
jgi:hypothetical protein